ncbi:MAG: DUF1460 domain-containing protein [Longimicrobiales bacterium]|nr:DUF1460 domain-containing protein [Longimicrobiales bacterium]
MRRAGASLLLSLLLVPGCQPRAEGGEEDGEGASIPPPSAAAPTAPPAGTAYLRPEGSGAWPTGADSIAGTPWTHEDWRRFRAVLEDAERRGLDTLPLGDAIAEMGALFLGTPYVPRTLEVPGPERLVVNLRGLDCVTLVENVLALTRFHRLHGVAVLDDPPTARRRFEAALTELRYRDGRVAGYPSRLHYFSEWIEEGARRGRLQPVTPELGGESDPEPITFMTAHAEAYPQLADPQVLAEVRAHEARLGAGPARVYLPQDRIAEAAAGIRNGDVIAATSTLAGLDVAHTGIAYWKDGVLHLLHAPLVGSHVVLSERSLAERIRGIGSQDGILVARPLPTWFGGERMDR